MIAEKVKATNIGVGIGIVVQLIGGHIDKPGTSLAWASWPVFLVGLAFFTWGCINYVEGKGYSKYLGLLGLTSCIGMVLLIFLPDRCKDGRLPSSSISYGPTQDGVWPPPPNVNNDPPKE
jgi:hypothetical protein